MRSIGLAAMLLFLVSSAWSVPFRFRQQRSQRLRQADSNEGAAAQAGAWIRTAGAGWKVEPGSPQRNQFVNGGGFIAGGGHYLNLHPGVQFIAQDKNPATTTAPRTFGHNVVLVNQDPGSASSQGSSGPPFPGGASGQAPHGNNKDK